MDEKQMPTESKDQPLEQAIERLEHAEGELGQARAAEERAEQEVEKALEEVKQAKAEHHEYTIVVNGRPKQVAEKKQSYRDIARLAYPDADFSRFLYTITYFNGEGGREGDLLEGESVRVKNEMVFNVRRSDKS